MTIPELATPMFQIESKIKVVQGRLSIPLPSESFSEYWVRVSTLASSEELLGDNYLSTFADVVTATVICIFIQTLDFKDNSSF